MTIRNNAPGGTRNDLGLDNISFRACGPDADIIADSNQIFTCSDSQPINLRTNISTNDQQFVQWQLSEDQGMSWADIPDATDQIFVHDRFIPGQYFYRYLVAQSDINLRNAKCRVVSDTTSVEILPMEFSVSETICEGVEYVIGTQTLSTSGIYVETLQGRTGCDSIVTLDLTVIPDPGLQLEVELTDPNCFDTNTGSLTITNVVNGTAPFQYIVQGDTIDQSSLTELPSGDLTLKVVDNFLCEVEETYNLIYPPEFVIDLGEDQAVLLGDRISFSVMSNEDIATYFWNTTPDQDDCPNCDEVQLFAKDNVSFELTATDFNGCQATDTISITVDKNYDLYFPNSISPNGDGMNDRFIVQAREGLVEAIESISIFDRWGNLIYDTHEAIVNDVSTGRDGTMNKEAIMSGSFAYVMSIRFVDQTTQRFSGVVTVMN